MDALNCGSVLGRYELLVRLGRGGMASVWVAREREAANGEQRLVALKAMLPELAGYSDFRSMFLEEGQIIRSIDHENVVKVYDVSEDRGVLFMAMEWVEGDSLRAVIKEARRRRPIPPEMAVKIIADAASGLHAAHELRGWDGELRNVVHCDVSPHNILVGLDGRAKIVDFGVAHARLHSDLSEQDKVKGKYAYMSPEQARGEKIDRRSDVFSLGIVLFELTTGERLFRGESPAHSLHLVTASEIPDPRSIRPEYPERLAQIVTRALDRDPARRFPTAAALRDALERYLVEERILVSHGSVAQLVRRVLGARIEQLRQSLREALVVRDGVIAHDLIPDVPAVAGTFTSELPSNASRSSGYSASSRPQTYETPAPQRSGVFPLLAAITGVAAAAGSIFWFTQRPGPAPLVSLAVQAASAQTAASRPAAASDRASAPAAGIDVASLPVGAEATLAATTSPRHAPSGRGGRRADAKSGEADPSAVELTEDSAPEPEAAPAEPAAPDAPPAEAPPSPADVALAEEAPPPVAEPEPPAPEPRPEPPPGERGPFNRGAAMAQLGSAASRAASCKRPDGPSGSGRASITFSPGGGAPKVAIPPPFAGTAVGGCLASVFSGARVPAFTGSAVTLPWSFRVPE